MSNPIEVAVAGAIEAVPSSALHPKDVAKAGKWTVTKVEEQLGTQVKVQGKVVVIGATATFKYVGGMGSNNQPLTQPPELLEDTVELVAQPTALKDAGKAVLVATDTATGAGTVDSRNQIKVKPQQSILKTSHNAD